MNGDYKVCRTISDVKSVISNESNSFDVHIESELPETTKTDKCILGIDEAGRGPVLGILKKKKTLVIIECMDVFAELAFITPKTYPLGYIIKVVRITFVALMSNNGFYNI